MMECFVCLEKYNEGKRLPRTLHCGHTLCTQCLSQIMKRCPLQCPYCRAYHTGTVLCPADIPLDQQLTKKLTEGRELDEEDITNDHSETKQFSVLKLREDIKKLNEAGHSLWSIQATPGGQTRHSQVSLLGNRLHLHTLQDGEPPSAPHTVPYNELQDLQDEDFHIVFLDVSCREVYQGRVYIVLLDHEGRTRQFKAFCTGQHGPSYKGTRFFEVSRKNLQGEQIWGGDYENNDGTAGAALPGMDRGRKNNQDVVAGLVAGFYFPGYGQDHAPSQFGIYTKNLPHYVEMSSIGNVIAGMDIVNNMTKLDNIQDAFVSDCGLLLCH